LETNDDDIEQEGGALIKFRASPAAREAIVASGMEPVSADGAKQRVAADR
jgi:hypothetical protein